MVFNFDVIGEGKGTTRMAYYPKEVLRLLHLGLSHSHLQNTMWMIIFGETTMPRNVSLGEHFGNKVINNNNNIE